MISFAIFYKLKLGALKKGAPSFGFILLVVTVLAYGLLLPRLGFYWDDLPWLWYQHLQGAAGMLQIDRGYRPLAGVILWLGGVVAGVSPLGWQMYNLILRWFSGLAFFWMLNQWFPRQREQNGWATLLFLVYPAFTQQFIAVNSSRHIFPLITFCLSFGWMFRTVRADGRRAQRASVLGIASSAFTLLATDYYFGLELLRPLALLPLLFSNKRRIFSVWLLYLSVYLPVVVWRFIISPNANYEVHLFDQFLQQPVMSLWKWGGQLLGQTFTANVWAWLKILNFPETPEFRFRRVVGYWVLVLITALGMWLFLRMQPSQRFSRRLAAFWFVFGVLATFLGTLPFWAAQIPLGMAFPADRTLLPLAFGAALALVGVLAYVPLRRAPLLVLFALLLAFSVGAQFATAAQYEQDWEMQTALYRQLRLRALGIRSNTAVLYQHTDSLQNFRSTSNSLTALLNWMYAPNFEQGGLPYLLLDLRSQASWVLPALQNQQALVKAYGGYTFESVPEHTLVLHWDPPACLQVLEARYAKKYPRLPDALAESVQYSNMAVILLEGDAAHDPALEAIFGAVQPETWCDYYQLAEAARQAEQWSQVAYWGDVAFARVPYPQQPIERIPFILGYGHVGRWARAEQLTLETLRADGNARRLLCAVWQDLTALPNAEGDENFARLQTRLQCEQDD